VKKFPAATFAPGGLPYIATHNNNARPFPHCRQLHHRRCHAGGPGDTIDQYRSAWAGEDHLQQYQRSGHIWVGPSGEERNLHVRGGTGSHLLHNRSYQNLQLYVATQSGYRHGGNETVDAVVYAITKAQVGPSTVMSRTAATPLSTGRSSQPGQSQTATSPSTMCRASTKQAISPTMALTTSGARSRAIARAAQKHRKRNMGVKTAY